MITREEPTQADPRSPEQDSLTTIDKGFSASTGLSETTNNPEGRVLYPDSKVRSTRMPE